MSDKTDVQRGAEWAKWLGIVKMVVGVIMLFVLASSDLPPELVRFSALDLLLGIGIGVLSLYLGLRLLSHQNRKSTQFTILMAVYSIALFFHVFNWLATSYAGQKPTGQVVPILTAWAIWMFIKGRRELKQIESSMLSS